MCAIACDAVAAPGITQPTPPTPPILITAHRVKQFIDAYTRFVRPIFFFILYRIVSFNLENPTNKTHRKRKKNLKTANANANANAIYGPLNIHHQCR